MKIGLRHFLYWIMSLAGILGLSLTLRLLILAKPVPLTTTFIQKPSSEIQTPTTTFSKNFTDNSNTIHLPNEFTLFVPFTPQAPTGNWDSLHKEACEEATAIMAYAYFLGHQKSILEPEWVEKEIADLVGWQTHHQGYYADQSLAEISTMLETHYLLNTKILPSYTYQDIQEALVKNQLIIVSVHGQMLNNPHFTAPGPIHHTLLITGFKNNQLITNDSGTKHGKNYIYSFSTVLKSTGDWNHVNKNLDLTQKPALLVWLK